MLPRIHHLAPLRTWRHFTIGFAILSLSLIVTAAAHAHGKSVSYSSWDLAGPDANVHEVSLRISRLELTRLGLGLRDDPESIREIGDYLARHLSLRADEVPCKATAPAKPLRAREGWLSFRLTLACEQPGPLVIESTILLEAAPSHLHFARVRPGASNDSKGSAPTILERVLTGNDPRWPLAGADEAEGGDQESVTGSSFARYGKLGIEHILSGWDHLAFLIALLLLANSLGEVAWLVTGFTLAHSVTLVLAVLGVLRPDPPAVEAVIGFSVALVALENGWELTGRDRRVPAALAALLLSLFVLCWVGHGALSRTSLAGLMIFSLSHFGLLARVENVSRVRVALAFCFGLVHGFGFAGVLEEMALPTERLVPALLGFNLGVEIGQLAVVALVWPLLRLLAETRGGVGHRIAAELASAGICGLGLYWFALRTLS